MKSKSVTQISGLPGQLVGAVPLRTSGTGTIKIVGDTLQGNFTSFFGLEIKEIVIPIQNVKAVEIGEGCTWWLLGLGILTLGIFFIGIIFIVLAFVVKQRYIVIYTSSNNLILFYSKSDKINQFRNEIIEACRPKPSYIPRPSQSPPAPPSLAKVIDS
ncbi:hypothetical protein [Microcoleus sp.]|uniref:hypothetical protein n=1 Tax=Microcoleus sp. TaxID=44472 RepID=UPI003593EE29